MEMKKYKLRDLISIKNGCDHKKLKDGMFPVYGSGGIMRYVDSYLYDKESVLLPRKGTLDNIQYVNEPFWTVDTIYYTELNNNLIDAYYLYRYLSLLDLSGLDSGTGVPSMTFDAYYNIAIEIPSLEEQKKIANVLSSLDDKIALNNRVNAKLEQMAKRLYDYWFVQFDFPRSVSGEPCLHELSRTDDGNARSDFPGTDGKPYKSSGGKMVWNEELKREIPEGWEVKKLGDVTEIVLGGTPSTQETSFWNQGTINWLNSGEVGEFPIVTSEKKITEIAMQHSSTEFLKAGAVTLSITRYLRPSILAIDACINQSVVGLKENKILKNCFMYPYLQNEVDRLMSLRTGAQQPHINKETVEESYICVPTEEIMDEYNKRAQPIYNQIISVAKQNKKLSELRDKLLPLLMNGQVVVE